AFSLRPESLIEMVGPTVSYFRGSNARLLVCATPATIRSEIYQSAFRMVGKDAEYVAIPGLASAIEDSESRDRVEEVISDAFKNIDVSTFDALVLACTHYPLVSDSFRSVLGDSLVLFDPAIAVAERVEKQLWPREAGDGETKFITSQDSETFR